MKASILSAALALGGHALAKQPAPANQPSLSSRIQSYSADIFPDLKAISLDIWNHPELGRSEHHAHDIIVDYFSNQRKGEWNVTAHAHGMETSWRLEFENKPKGTGCGQKLPVIGFLAEYDALPEVGHACGHNQIVLVGMTAASLVRKAVIELGIAARVVVVGTPDEEGEAGKLDLLKAGAFDGVDVWLIAHPSPGNVLSPLNSRINVLSQFRRDSHNAVVREAYDALVAVRNLANAGLPGTASSVTPVEDVGMFASNVVQGHISLGISGSTLEKVQETVGSIFDSTYPGVTYTVTADASVPGGVNLTVLGPGGHASEATKSPLVLTIETFRALTTDAQEDEKLAFYLPGNTTCSALDVTFNLRSRYTADLDSVKDAVEAAVRTTSVAAILTDTVYPSLELTPVLPELFLEVTKAPELYGPDNDWTVSKVAPASTDAAYLQNAVVDPATHALLSADKVVFHPSFGICDPSKKCASNHEPAFRELAGTDYGLGRAEVVSRALAELSVKLLSDKKTMKDVTAIMKKKKNS